MTRKLLFLVVGLVALTANVIWAETEAGVLTVEFTPKEKCFANGYPITITQASDTTVTITVDGTGEAVTFSSAVMVYGGSQEKDVASTKVTMVSGKIKNLYSGGLKKNAGNTDVSVIGGEITSLLVAGGYGEADGRGDVTGKATIYINNATVNQLHLGGVLYAKTKEAEATINGENTKITTLLGGGYAPNGVAGQGLDQSYENTVNGVEVSTINMTNGTITGDCFIGGGFSYSYSKEVTATLTGVTINGGLFGVGSNGRSDNVTVTATGCKFVKTTKPLLIAGVNRGRVGSVSMTFDNCTFPTNPADYYLHLGAAEGWKNGNYPTPTSEEATFVFTGASARPVVKVSQGINNLTLTGVAARLDVVVEDRRPATYSTENSFTIPADKTWTFNNGLTMTGDATLTKEGSLTVRDIFTIAKATDLPLALSSVTSGARIKLAGVTAEAMLEQLNKDTGAKGGPAAGICIFCSDATVYTDEASAWRSTAEGAQYLKFAGGEYSLATLEAVAPVIDGNPTASIIEAGQTLSASLLKGGEATVGGTAVSGVFSWKNPAKIAKEGTNSYMAIFTPSDLMRYNVVEDIEVTIANVKQYYTVTTGKTENGTLTITGGNKAGKYVKDTTLAIVATPAEHYEFSSGTNTGTYTVAKDTVLTAKFAPKNYTVTVGANVKVTPTVTSGASLPYGTVLHVVANPTGDEGSLKTLTCNGNEIINNTVTVNGNLDIQATFNDVVEATYRVSLADDVVNGNILLFDGAGNEIAFGSKLAAGTQVSVVTLPDLGYQLTTTGVTVTGATYGEGIFTVGTSNVTVSATFEKKKFAVTNNSENATIELNNTSGSVDFDTSIQIKSATANDGYKLLAVVVNGKEIAVGESFTVKGETVVNAVTKALPKVAFMDTEQTYTYNKNAQAFVVRTIPAGISGVAIAYKKGSAVVESPTDAGTYDVLATFEATTSYSALNAEKIGTLVIEKAPKTDIRIPSVADIQSGEEVNSYYWKSNTHSDGKFRTAAYRLPENSNYHEPEFVIPATDGLEKSLTKVTLGLTTRAAVSLTLGATNGSISLWNGETEVTEDTPLYVGQTLTLKGMAVSGEYSSIPTWSNVTKDNKDGTATITLPSSAATVKATFNTKAKATLTSTKYESTYTGMVFGGTAPVIGSTLSGWVITFEQEGLKVNEPTNAGTYNMKASRSADAVYDAVEGINAGTLVIAQATSVISEVVGTEIYTFQTLNQSTLSGKANVDGVFSWVNPDQAFEKGTYNNVEVLFTPSDANYASVKRPAKVVVSPLPTGVAAPRTLQLTENGATYGTGVVITLNGTEVKAGTTVKAGDLLTVSFGAKGGYTATAQVNAKSYSNGSTFTIGEEGNVTIEITYTRADSGVDVNSISLDKTELDLDVLDTYTLIATINPSDATNKLVTWETSDEEVATVDKDGKVTGVGVGTATITVTTDDGGKKATCVVTVTSATTGLEGLATDSRVYSQNGRLIVETATAQAVQVYSLTGKQQFARTVNGTETIALTPGVYIVRVGREIHKIVVR